MPVVLPSSDISFADIYKIGIEYIHNEEENIPDIHHVMNDEDNYWKEIFKPYLQEDCDILFENINNSNFEDYKQDILLLSLNDMNDTVYHYYMQYVCSEIRRALMKYLDAFTDKIEIKYDEDEHRNIIFAFQYLYLRDEIYQLDDFYVFRFASKIYKKEYNDNYIEYSGFFKQREDIKYVFDACLPPDQCAIIKTCYETVTDKTNIEKIIIFISWLYHNRGKNIISIDIPNYGEYDDYDISGLAMILDENPKKLNKMIDLIHKISNYHFSKKYKDNFLKLLKSL